MLPVRAGLPAGPAGTAPPASCKGEETMGLIYAVIMGGIVGWLASMFMKTNAQMGLVANIVVGIAGSALGFWIAGLLGVAATGGIARFLVAIAGAALLIVILQKLGLFKKG
jgi:uncharacterized membrane protein YeaQ/YmgE (transglycosylase-associated protein family)